MNETKSLLIGGFNPLKNISQIGSSSQLLWKIKNVPNHEPVYDRSHFPLPNLALSVWEPHGPGWPRSRCLAEHRIRGDYTSGWWLTYPSEKIWVRQLGWWHSQYMESHKIPWFQTTRAYIFIPENLSHLPEDNWYIWLLTFTKPFKPWDAQHWCAALCQPRASSRW